MPIPVIDLFAGPGGLSEGFAASRSGAMPLLDGRRHAGFSGEEPSRRPSSSATGRSPFRVALSIEKDPVARETLRLRAFFRQFPPVTRPEQYYDYLRGETDLKSLYDFFPDEAAAADREAWQAELGKTPPDEIDARITTALAGEQPWVLIGGPLVASNSFDARRQGAWNKFHATANRVGGIHADDHRVHLDRESLRILAAHRPAVFVMENVRGILSARVGDKAVISQIP